MASRLTTAAASSPARQKHSPKKSKKKAKEKNSPCGEAIAMGCSPSQAVIVQSTKTDNSHLHPTIFMVGEKSLQMLRDLGELKFYQLAQYNETDNTTETLHNDFAAQLENPLQYMRNEESKTTGNYQVTERSMCKISADYLIHAQKREIGLSDDGVARPAESSAGVNNLLDNLPSNSTKNASDLQIPLSSNSLTRSSGTEIEIRAENTSTSPILLSGASPSHSKGEGSMTAAQNLNRVEAETAVSSNGIRNELNHGVNAGTSSSTTGVANDPLDEIVSAPDASCTTHEPANEGNVTPKTKTKLFFGRNRVMPKRIVSDKYDVRNTNNFSLGPTIDDS